MTAAVAPRQEREELGRYRALLAAARESLRYAEGRFSASSEAIDKHIQAALAAMVGRGRAYRSWTPTS